MCSTKNAASTMTAPQAAEPDVFVDRDGDAVTGRCLRLMDWVAYLSVGVPFLLLTAIAAADKRAAAWAAFIVSVTLLMLDYFRSRYYRNKIRYPDIVGAYSFIDLLALGITVELVPNFDALYLGPTYITLLLFGIMVSSGFQEAYPLHSSDWCV